ncbi:dynein axonemal intermediate chain 4 [Synchiropus splendidus]|uniref:dynein axonemal intermediate chain 4 n=1 Tax=Synchiropus splendidus TaxID=270530 RepID=UPI00237D7CBA|nr:dynein axonemal intermediate chain 4 [Synchiropus splendidus]
MSVREDRQRRLLLRPSSRLRNISQSTRLTSSLVSPSRRSLSQAAGSRLLDKRHAVRVIDEDGNDVTPLPLLQVETSGIQTRSSRFFLDDFSAGSASENTTASGSFSMPFSRSILGSSRKSSQSTIDSVNEEIEETFNKRDAPINIPDTQKKRDIVETVEEQVTEEMLSEIIDINITESDTISLLDIPSTAVSVDADDADTLRKRNSQYVKACRSRRSSDKHVDRSMQTLNGAVKNKQIQSDSVVKVDAGATATTWDIFDTFHSLEQSGETTLDPDRPKFREAAVDSSRGAERSASSSLASTGSASSSMREMESLGNTAGAESELQVILHSEVFHHSLLVMQRSVLANTFQSQLAAYRQLPVLQDPYEPIHIYEEEQEVEESSSSPALDHLWTYTCDLSRGVNVSCMAWNKKNLDLLAVGYGQFDCRDQAAGLVCCWSIKNPTWPERVINCESAVTSLDFSANNPSQLAVGMQDGSIVIYDLQSPAGAARLVSSRDCSNKHLGPVWQLRWTHQELSLVGEEKVEALFSVAADGRVCKWFVSKNGFDCQDLMKLKRLSTIKAVGNKSRKNTESLLSTHTAGMCFNFHPSDSSVYLAGTWEGLIHKCSCSNNQQFLETYKKHFCPVNNVSWSPHSPDLFLSCSSDWTIQLWKQDNVRPLLEFTSSQRAVRDIKWSPRWATVFGAIKEDQLEIWNLESSLLDPVAVQSAPSGVKLSCLLFASQTNCVLVGDSSGQVMLYQLKNLRLDEERQRLVLEDIISSSVDR